jgi:hypothetical protein
MLLVVTDADPQNAFEVPVSAGNSVRQPEPSFRHPQGTCARARGAAINSPVPETGELTELRGLPTQQFCVIQVALLYFDRGEFLEPRGYLAEVIVRELNSHRYVLEKLRIREISRRPGSVSTMLNRPQTFELRGLSISIDVSQTRPLYNSARDRWQFRSSVSPSSMDRPQDRNGGFLHSDGCLNQFSVPAASIASTSAWTSADVVRHETIAAR